MAFLNNFNASEVNPNDQYAPLPAGNYPVVITESSMRDTKNGSGNYLALTMEVCEGEFQGRKIFHNLTRENQNVMAREIGDRQLSQICHAVGVMNPRDSEELHFKPLLAVVKIRKGDGQYADRNEVQRFEGYSATSAPAPAHNPAPRQQQAHAAPWAAAR